MIITTVGTHENALHNFLRLFMMKFGYEDEEDDVRTGTSQ